MVEFEKQAKNDWCDMVGISYTNYIESELYDYNKEEKISEDTLKNGLRLQSERVGYSSFLEQIKALRVD